MLKNMHMNRGTKFLAKNKLFLSHISIFNTLIHAGNWVWLVCAFTDNLLFCCSTFFFSWQKRKIEQKQTYRLPYFQIVSMYMSLIVICHIMLNIWFRFHSNPLSLGRSEQRNFKHTATMVFYNNLNDLIVSSQLTVPRIIFIWKLKKISRLLLVALICCFSDFYCFHLSFSEFLFVAFPT